MSGNPAKMFRAFMARREGISAQRIGRMRLLLSREDDLEIKKLASDGKKSEAGKIFIGRTGCDQRDARTAVNTMSKE